MRDHTVFRYRIGYAAIIITFCVVVSTPLASYSKRNNVLDYYLALPDEYFMCESAPKITREFKEKLVIRKNIKNGYIQAQSEGHPMEVALFADDHLKLALLAVNIKCGAGCMCNKFDILNMSGGKWNTVTSEVFPTDDQIRKSLKDKDMIYEYVLPETGTVIKVVDVDTKKVALNIHWSGGMFMIK